MGNPPVRLSEHFATSGRFKKLFGEGMALVEESAAFLDGNGRQLAKHLPRKISVLYATESMRLTTRLMQMASWLLLQRAMGEGELSREQLLDEKKKLKFDGVNFATRTPSWQELPEEFTALVERSLALQGQVRRLDDELFAAKTEPLVAGENPVNAQLNLLSTALGAKQLR